MQTGVSAAECFVCSSLTDDSCNDQYIPNAGHEAHCSNTSSDLDANIESGAGDGGCGKLKVRMLILGTEVVSGESNSKIILISY